MAGWRPRRGLLNTEAPINRSLQILRDQGYYALDVRARASGTSTGGKSPRLFGFMEIMAFNPNTKKNLVVVMMERNMPRTANRIMASQQAASWLRAGNKIEIHFWRKRDTYIPKRVSQQRTLFQLDVKELTI